MKPKQPKQPKRSVVIVQGIAQFTFWVTDPKTRRRVGQPMALSAVLEDFTAEDFAKAYSNILDQSKELIKAHEVK